nr:hypothetical protein [uncultured Methanobrevibacter sp.]
MINNVKNTHVFDSFKLDYGKVLENVEVEYVTVGIPKYDDEGYITNAIIFCPTYKKSLSVLKGAHNYLKENGKFNRDEFFFIIITPLGSPNSFSPSSSGLMSDFPQYNVIDIVNFKKQLLDEKFKIKKILGVIGEEISGYEVFAWACEYPDDMEFILILNSDYKISGYRYIISKGFETIIDSIDDYHLNQHSVSALKALNAINTFLFAQSFSEKVFSNLSKDEIEALLDDFVDEGMTADIYDVNFRNSAILEFDTEDKLKNIKAKALIINSDESVYFNKPADVDILKENINDLKVLSFKTQKENLYDEEDYSLIGLEVIEFLNECLKN